VEVGIMEPTDLENHLSKGARWVVGVVMTAGAAYVLWATITETGPARWLIDWQADLLGRYSLKLTGALLLVPAVLVGYASGFLWDWATGQGLFGGGGSCAKEIRIVAIPPGEAPEEVRRAWVGLVLPLAKQTRGPLLARGFGVLSGRGQPTYGYAVPAARAVEILSQHAPEAAAWWTQNVPHNLRPGRVFLFHAEVCQEV
jgi:hypothetical protein